MVDAVRNAQILRLGVLYVSSRLARHMGVAFALGFDGVCRGRVLHRRAVATRHCIREIMRGGSNKHLSLLEERLVLLLRLDEGLLEEVGVLRVAEADGESLGLWLALRDIGGGVPDPAAVAANVGRELHVRDDCE